MFYHFNQNNSGGTFHVDKNAGLTRHVLIEADSPEEANLIATDKGIYFDGCSSGEDCPCCGDRWYPVGDYEASKEPQVYGEPFTEHKDTFVKKGSAVAVHYKDGRIAWA